MSRQTHIVVVEDEEHMAVGLKYNLEAEGYLVSTFTDGPAALHFLEQDQPVDLVILDIMLPGLNGYAVCESLRSKGNDVPILLLSARTLSEDRSRGFDVGANQYLTKPFDLEELLSRVRNLIKFQQGSPSKTGVLRKLRFGNVSVDFDSHEVRVGEKMVRMTKLELELLRYLARNQGRVISREELLQNVWDLPPHLNTRAPDQFISRLRKAFEPDPSKPRYIITLRDAGYRFVTGDQAT